MASRLFCSAVAMMFLVLAVPASAATVLFNLQSLDNFSSPLNASWTADLSPTPSYVGSSSFYITVSYLTGDPGNGDHNVGFFTPDYAVDGGMFLYGNQLYGSQVFTGPLDNRKRCPEHIGSPVDSRPSVDAATVTGCLQ